MVGVSSSYTYSSALSDSHAMALKRFLNFERLLIKYPTLALQYNKLMDELMSQMRHMELADIQCTGKKYYLPHHVVFKLNSSITKFQVVFDGSATTSFGLSLNDILLKCPKVQPDIVKILWRFRIHNIAIDNR